MLERGLVAVTVATRMAADIEHGRQFRARLGVLGEIKVARDIKMRAALEVELLHTETLLPLDHTGDLRVKRRTLGQRPETEHLEVLLAQLRASRFPLLTIGDAVK